MALVRRSSIVGTVALLCASLGVGLAVLEVAFRVLHVPVGTVQINRATIRKSDNPRLMFELRPGGRARAEVEYRINGLGLRGPEAAETPKAGVRRVAVVGDSITFGYWVEEGDGWPRQLEGLLGPGVEVLNFGVPGYNLDQEIEVVRSRARGFEPDTVVVGFCLNDLEGIFSYEYGLTLGRASRRSSAVGRIYDGLLSRSVLLSFVEYRLTELEARRRFADAKNPLGGKLYEEAVAEQRVALLARFGVLAELLKPRGTRGIVVVFPSMGNRFANYPHRALHEAVTSAALEAGLEAVDLVECFSPYDYRDLRVDVVHPSPLGHRVAAHAVRDAICTHAPCPPVDGTCTGYRPGDFRKVRGY